VAADVRAKTLLLRVQPRSPLYSPHLWPPSST